MCSSFPFTLNIKETDIKFYLYCDDLFHFEICKDEPVNVHPGYFLTDIGLWLTSLIKSANYELSFFVDTDVSN